MSRRDWLRALGVTAAGVSVAALSAGCSPGSNPAVADPAPATPAAVPTGPAILGANESPFGPAPSAVDAMSKMLTLTARYADPETMEFSKIVAGIEGVAPEQVFVANGSSPILAAWGEMIAKNGKGQLVTSAATYEGVPRTAAQYGAQVIFAPLTKELTLDLDAMASRITAKTTGVYVNNPNNPTGTMVKADKLYDFAKTASKTAPVFIDEAYLDLCDDYAGNVMTKLLREGNNVVICRTFSKIYGMAGQRLGYGMSTPEVAQQMAMNVRMGGVNHLGLVAGMASLQDASFLPSMKPKFARGRAMLVAMAEEFKLEYAPNPQASFVFMNVGMPNKVFAEKMKAEGVIVVGRTWAGYDNWTRICVGEDWELDRCRTAMKKVLAA